MLRPKIYEIVFCRKHSNHANGAIPDSNIGRIFYYDPADIGCEIEKRKALVEMVVAKLYL